MRKTRVIEGKRHRILMSIAIVEFAVAIASFRVTPSAAVLPFALGLAFVFFDRMGVPAVEVGIGGSSYRIYPNWNFSSLIIDGDGKRRVRLLPGRNAVELNGKELIVDARPGRFFPTVSIEFEGERVKLF